MNMKGEEHAMVGIVEGKEEKANGVAVKIQSGFFGGQYPQIVTFPPDVGAKVSVGREVNIVIKAENLKTSQQTNQPHDGSQRYHYYWSYVRQAPTNDVASAKIPDAFNTEVPVGWQAAPPREQTQMADHPSKRRSIERQVALDRSITLALASKAEATLDSILDRAQIFYEWIAKPVDAPKVAQEPAAAPDHPLDDIPEPDAMTEPTWISTHAPPRR